MTYEELLVINFGTPSIELLNKFIREQEAISIFYKNQLKRDKRPYWKGKIMNSSKIKNSLIKHGIELYGEKFKSKEMGLTETEKRQCNENN